MALMPLTLRAASRRRLRRRAGTSGGRRQVGSGGRRTLRGEEHVQHLLRKGLLYSEDYIYMPDSHEVGNARTDGLPLGRWSIPAHVSNWAVKSLKRQKGKGYVKSALSSTSAHDCARDKTVP